MLADIGLVSTAWALYNIFYRPKTSLCNVKTISHGFFLFLLANKKESWHAAAWAVDGFEPMANNFIRINRCVMKFCSSNDFQSEKSYCSDHASLSVCYCARPTSQAHLHKFIVIFCDYVIFSIPAQRRRQEVEVRSLEWGEHFCLITNIPHTQT